MNIEIFSDLICPWCYIGKRRLDRALAGPAGEGVSVVWRAYQLYPDIPAEGMDREQFMQFRYGSTPPAAVRARIEEEARAAGIGMQFSGIGRMPNTFQGHRLLHLSRQRGVQHALAETLFQAYFEQGLDLGDTRVLLDAAGQHGMDRNETADYLASDAGTDAVQGEIQRAAMIGVTGVPCFVFAGAFALPGAQESQVIAQVLERVKAKLAEPVDTA